MQTYKTPLKNPAAASFSLLLGLVVIAAMALSLRIADNEQLTQKADSVSETSPVDPLVSGTQQMIQNDREGKLGAQIPIEQKTTTTTQPTKTTTLVPTPTPTTPAPAAKKSNRTTKTS